MTTDSTTYEKSPSRRDHNESAALLSWTAVGGLMVTSLWVLPYNLPAGLALISISAIFIVSLFQSM